MNDGAPKRQFAPIPPEMERVARIIVDAIFKVRVTLGPGLLENVYEVCLCRELENRGLKVIRQVVVPIVYEGLRIENALKLDILVEDCIILELKAIENVLPVHRAQLLTYLRLSGRRLGFLVNFNVALIKDGIDRLVV